MALYMIHGMTYISASTWGIISPNEITKFINIFRRLAYYFSDVWRIIFPTLVLVKKIIANYKRPCEN